MMEIESNEDRIWIIFMRRHWKAFILFVIGAIMALIGAILVYLWFVGDAQSTGLVPMILSLWTMGHLVSFILNLIIWEFLLIGVPIIIVVLAIYFIWWKKLPYEERGEYRRGNLFGSRSRSSNGGGAISFIVFIAFLIKVYIDGNWNVPFADWTFDYLVYSYLEVFIWILIIIGIPMAIGGTLWLHRELKRRA